MIFYASGGYGGGPQPEDVLPGEANIMLSFAYMIERSTGRPTKRFRKIKKAREQQAGIKPLVFKFTFNVQ